MHSIYCIISYLRQYMGMYWKGFFNCRNELKEFFFYYRKELVFFRLNRAIRYIINIYYRNALQMRKKGIVSGWEFMQVLLTE